MKLNYYLISICILLKSYFINKINTQIYYGPSTDTDYWVDPVKWKDLNFDITNTTIGTKDANRQYSRYEYSFLRIHLKNLSTKFHGYIDFHPRVDEFTTIKIPNSDFFYNKLSLDESFGAWTDEDNSYRVSAQLLGAKTITTFSEQKISKPCWVNGKLNDNKECKDSIESENKVYYINEISYSTNLTPIELSEKKILDYDKQTFVSPFVIVINLDKGIITDAQWDGDRLPNLCKGCKSCIDNQCGSDYSDMSCNPNKDNSKLNPCILKFMVAWVGTDKNGRSCKSFDKIPSNFEKYSSTPLQQLGSGYLKDFYYRATYNKDPNQA